MIEIRGIIVFVGVLMTVLLAQAQAPDTLWTKTYGGLYTEEAFEVYQTIDGGYILVGITNSYGAGNWDIYLIKTYPNGDTIWTRTYGGTTADAGHAMCIASDGGYVVAGARHLGDWDILLMKTDAQGNQQWTEIIGGMMNDWLESICQNPDSGYVATGAINVNNYNTSGNLVVMKFDADGDTLWVRSYGGSSYDGGTSIDNTDDGYIVCGFTNSYGTTGPDIWLLRTNMTGMVQWAKIYGGTASEYATSVSSTDDGGFVIAGYTSSYGAGNWDAYLVKTDSNGDSVWARTYGGSMFDAALDVFQTDDGGYIVTGFIDGSNEWEGGDVWIMKTDANGDVIWTSTFGAAEEDWGFFAQPTTDNGFIIAAKTWSFGAGAGDIYLIKLAPEPGITENNSHMNDGCRYNVTIVHGPLSLPSGKKSTVYDICGREVHPTNLCPGIYFIEIEGTVTHKIIKIK